MSMYNPDVWVVVELSGKKVHDQLKSSRYHRILAGWYGGFAGSDSWKLNSGITTIVDKGNYYEIHGSSGSVYNCGKEVERFSGYAQSIYHGFVSQNNEDISLHHVEMKDILPIYLKGE